MSMVSDALRKAQAESALRSEGIRLDLTGMGGHAPRRPVPWGLVGLLAVVALAMAVAVPATVYLVSVSTSGNTARVAGAMAGHGAAAMGRPAMPVPSATVPPAHSPVPTSPADVAAMSPTTARGGAGGASLSASPPDRPKPAASPRADAANPHLTRRTARNPQSPPLVAASAEPATAALTGDPKLQISNLKSPPAPERTAHGADAAAASGAVQSKTENRKSKIPTPSAPLIEGGEYVGTLHVAGLPRLELTGIVWSHFTKIALVNGMSLEPSDIVQNIRVIEIKPKRVEFLTPDGRTFYMRMR